MRTTRVLTAVGLAALIAGPAFAQQSPPGLDWRRIRTERFNVIFPARITSDAQRVANTLEHIYGPVSKTLKGPEKPVDVVLMNQVAEANGFVAMAPRRTVWFSTPPQGTGLSGEWYQLLAVHEMRHVVQNDRLRRGFIRLAWLLSGEFGQSAMSHLLVPSWFWEGDAVGIETALSTTGRGRMPRFDLDIRALLLDGRRYSYYKALHRSYRDWYPSHYPLGYFLTTYVRRHHGAGTWDRVLGRTAWWGFHPFSFSRALRKHTGASAAGTYERAMDELTGLWQAQQEGLVTTPLRVLPGQSRSDIWTNYSYPHPLPDGSLLASKVGLADPPTLVRLHPDGREERLRQYSSLGGFRAGGGIAAWNRRTPDPRWGFRSYSDIMVLEIDSGRARQLTRKAGSSPRRPLPTARAWPPSSSGRTGAATSCCWRPPRAPSRPGSRPPTGFSGADRRGRRTAAISPWCARTRPATPSSASTPPTAGGRSCCPIPTTSSAGRSSGVPTCSSTPPGRGSTTSTPSTWRAGPATG